LTTVSGYRGSVCTLKTRSVKNTVLYSNYRGDRGDTVSDCTRQVYNLGNGGVPVRHDPVHGIVANPGNREWEPFPLSFFVVCDNPVHGVMVN
jgi:hypothetical protein